MCAYIVRERENKKKMRLYCVCVCVRENKKKNAELMCAACEPMNVRFLVQITTDGMYT